MSGTGQELGLQATTLPTGFEGRVTALVEDFGGEVPVLVVSG